MTNAWAFKLRGDAQSETLEIDVYDVIGYDWWDGGGVTAKGVRGLLKANKTASTIKLRINSEGGDVFDAWAIYNLLVEHPARVEADVDALAASAASIILQAADERRIASNAFVMIHNAWGGYRGEADDLRRMADVLEKMSLQAADIYAARTGKSREEMIELMNAETWMTGAEALARGFVDKVIPLKTAASSQGSKKAAARAFACMSIDDYTNVPPAVREAVAAARKQHETESRQLGLPRTEPSPRADEAPSETEETPMNKKLIAQALGISESATDETFETAAVALAAEHKSVKDALKAANATIAQVEEAAAVSGAGLVGAVKAGVENGKKLEAANAKIAEHTKATDDSARAKLIAQGKDEGKLNAQLEIWAATQTTAALEAFLKAADGGGDTKRTQLLAQGKADRKLTPALETYFADKPVADLESFLKVAPPVIPAPLLQPVKPTTESTEGVAAAAAAAVPDDLKHEGKTYAELKPAQRADLSKKNPELYRKMRDDHKQRAAA